MMAHALGNPFDLRTTLEFCKEHQLWLIEDNCDALGCRYTLSSDSAAIDDYSKEDPLPPGMLEMMRQSDMLGLFKKVLDEPVMSVDASNAPELESFVVQEKISSMEDQSIKDPLVLESQSLDEDKTLVRHQTGGTDQNAIPLNPIAEKAP
jgi:hypothetical protein